MPDHSHIQTLPRRDYVTTRTHEVFVLALRRAERLGHDDVTAVHILLGMLEEGHGIALGALHYGGVPLHTLRRELEAELPPAGLPRDPATKLSWTRGIEQVLEGAVVESRELGKEHYGTEHVLLAILRDPTSVPARVLAKYGAGYADVHSMVERIMNAKPGVRPDPTRVLLQHFLAAIAYRTQKALRDAPADFGDFRSGENVRTPHELVWHMTRVIGYARTMLRGGEFKPSAMETFESEIERFHAMLAALHLDLGDDSLQARILDEQFLQGPLADVMTHVGQLAMLRRLSGAPIPPEDFIHAKIRTEHVGVDQPLPASPDAGWTPDQPPMAVRPTISTHHEVE
jgi:hypothetical protein